MTMQVNGTIESKTSNGKSIKVNGEWYGAFSPTQVGLANVGDTVQFSVKEGKINPNSGKPYLNIAGNVTVSTGSPSSNGGVANAVPVQVQEEKVGLPVIHVQRCIIRQNALTAAVNFCRDVNFTPDYVISVARQFEAYTSGDIDEQEALESLGKGKE